jgi:hypothetical protein
LKCPLTAVTDDNRAVPNIPWQKILCREIKKEYAAQVLDGAGSGDAIYRGQVFVGCDDVPITYKQMMEYCQDSGVYEGITKFLGTDAPTGKSADGRATKARLGWAPKYTTFKKFVIEAKGKDFYNP